MEMKSPPPCPNTVTVRRNPHRKVRATPSSAIPIREPLASPSLSRNIFATETLQNPKNADNSKTDDSTRTLPENLKVFLRIRPLTVQKNCRTNPESKKAWPKNPKTTSNSRPKTKKSSEMCVQVSEDMRSVTVSTPKPWQELKRIKSEVYEGFSHVFSAESSQNDVYEEMVKPLVEDFLKGKSGMLAAMGPSGSGKTHTVFGCAREPGMVPLALRRIFSEDESSTDHSPRAVYLSVFEISSERGKTEKMIDLLHDGGDVCMQHSVIKGLQETVVCNAQQAESLIARGMLKRATAMTNSNSQSSRSQCIITIRCGSNQSCEEADGNTSNDTTLTIVDLAGAEREKKTGNQGARLLESNFINNTSMVFGQCLRSLLEHQKNRNKTMHKHYKNSMLTRYLRDYLEGKKRMTLILTIKPGVADFLDTSFLLKQASPFAKIKFKIVEETVVLTHKRPIQALTEVGQLKRMKCGSNETSLIYEGRSDRGSPQSLHKALPGEVIGICHNSNAQGFCDENIHESHAPSNGFVGSSIQEKLSLTGNGSMLKVLKDREYKVLQGFSKALWNVLKQYKEKLEGVEIENCQLRDNLANEKTRNLDLENRLTNAKLRIFDLEKLAKTPEVNSDIVSSARGLETTENEKVADPSAMDSIAIFTCSDGDDEQHPQQLEDLSECTDDAENMKGFKNSSTPVTCFRTNVLSASINSSHEFISCDDTCTSEASIQSTSRCIYTSHKSDRDAVNVVRDEKNLVPESEDITSISEMTIQSTGRFLLTSHKLERDAVNVVEDVTHLESESKDIPATSEVSILSTSRFLYASHEPGHDAVNVEGDVKNLESESECAMDGSCATSVECKNDISTQDYKVLKDSEQELAQFKKESEFAVDGSCLVTSLECESDKNSQDLEDLKDAKQELTQFHNDNCTSLLEEQSVPRAAAHFHADLESSESSCNGDSDDHVKELGTLEPQSIILPKEELDTKHKPEIVSKVASGNNQPSEKPKRRLQPASSVLLKDMSLFDLKDENDKPKGGKAGRRAMTDKQNRTQGSLHLLNLLTSKVAR